MTPPTDLPWVREIEQARERIEQLERERSEYRQLAGYKRSKTFKENWEGVIEELLETVGRAGAAEEQAKELEANNEQLRGALVPLLNYYKRTLRAANKDLRGIEFNRSLREDKMYQQIVEALRPIHPKGEEGEQLE